MEVMRYRLVFFTLSAVLLLVSLGSLLGFRLKPAVDFTGGSLTEIAVLDTAIESQEISEILF